MHEPLYIDPDYGSYETDCRDIPSWRMEVKEVDNGQSGHIIGKNYRIRFFCSMSFGEQCPHGVHTEVQDMNWLRHDLVYFTYVKDGVEYMTEKMYGCLENSPSHLENNCEYTYEYTHDYHYDYQNWHMADIVGKYDLAGTDVKVHFSSGYATSADQGGIFRFKWKCLPAPPKEKDPNARDPYERLLALEAKALEVAELGGWDQESAFHNRLTKTLERVITQADATRLILDPKCDFPAHWDWQEYLVCLYVITILF